MKGKGSQSTFTLPMRSKPSGTVWKNYYSFGKESSSTTPPSLSHSILHPQSTPPASSPPSPPLSSHLADTNSPPQSETPQEPPGEEFSVTFLDNSHFTIFDDYTGN
eukprot:TRINITY_DN5483_c0_g1_i1.p1 TRINITY_DN5483_c0_g1~~TRINITY_DN5483_c0_g1_i1.p1  ORF type:complete len:106 (+),score=22.54 TRINITY_DN5483_c0_g1_i1:85-402(+)